MVTFTHCPGLTGFLTIPDTFLLSKANIFSSADYWMCVCAYVQVYAYVHICLCTQDPGSCFDGL